jgi:hypothetical protein
MICKNRLSRYLFACLALPLSLSLFVAGTLAQSNDAEQIPDMPEAESAAVPIAEPTPPAAPKDEKQRDRPSDADSNAAVSGKDPSDWYTPPTPEVRRKRYINAVIGPVALIRYSTVAGVLTARNAPREWGGQWEGFGKRFASNLGESAINNTVKFGLDEALKVDSRFYLSRDRRPMARARNAVFSAVTARNREGKRVFGAPKIAGNLLSNVISATVWYPDRYGYKHGLKGAAISFAVDAGVNLFREFFWKK